MEANVTDEQMLILANAGLLQVYQRTPQSRAEKLMAGYEARPQGFKRSDIPFSEKGVEQMIETLLDSVEIADGQMLKATAATAKFYEIGKVAEPKYAEERKAIAKHLADNSFVAWIADKVGYPCVEEDAYKEETLKAVKAFKTRLWEEANS